MTFSSFTIKTSDNLILQFYHYAVEQPRYVLCLVHGMGEHAGRFKELISFYNANDFTVLAFDQRGHGRSEGQRGHTPSYELLMESITLALDQATTQYPKTAIILYGHSMGGNLVLNYNIRKGHKGIAAVVASSPWLQLAFSPPKWQITLAKYVYKMAPKLAQDTGLRLDGLSHDSKVAKEYLKDPLNHSKMTAGFFMLMYKAGHWAITHAAASHCNTFIIHGTADPITSAEASATFVQHSQEKAQLKTYDGLFHELHHEYEWKVILTDVLNWVKTNSPAS